MGQYNHIFLTGDTHGNFRRIEDFCNKFSTTKNDLLIILGDAGFNFYLNYKDDMRKDFVDSLPISVLCIHGNHEERPYLVQSRNQGGDKEPAYQEIDFAGGTAYFEPRFASLMFAKDGEIYDLNGKKAIIIGGAYSVDKNYRLMMGYPYFESELPSKEIKQHVLDTLDKADWKVDVVLSHTVPLKYEPVEWFMSGVNETKVDKSMETWLDGIEDRLDYKAWYAGHYHGEKTIDKLRIMFNDYIDLSDDLHRLNDIEKDSPVRENPQDIPQETLYEENEKVSDIDSPERE